MKTSSYLVRSMLSTSLALAMAMVAGSTGIAVAQQKGAERLIQLQPLKTAQDLKNLDAGDTLVMSCPKCKDSTATVVEQTFKNANPEELKATTIHLCPSCDTKVVRKGHGKAAKDVLVHTCKTCGSKDAFCCVMKKGGAATKGMEHEEQK